jgi:hypothetical protein
MSPRFTKERLEAASAAVEAEVRAIIAAGWTRRPEPRRSDEQFDHDADREGSAQ